MRLENTLLLLSFSVVIDLSSQCPTQFINITSSQWILPPTQAKTYSYCTYSFSFPDTSFAVLSVKATGVTSTDAIFLQNQHSDYFEMEKEGCSSDCDTMNSTTSWPGSFTVSVRTGLTTSMVLELNVTLKPMNVNAFMAGEITTSSNEPSSLIYFQDWKEGSTYIVTSHNSRVNLQVAVAFQFNSLAEWILLNNIFVFDGKKNIGTLSHIRDIGYVSLTKQITLYAAEAVSLRGAVFVTDNSNIRNLHHHEVQYASVFNEGNSTFVSVEGSLNSRNEAGAITIVGDKYGSTLITIRQLDNKGNGGIFSYLNEGPLANYDNQTTTLTNSNLPNTVNGQMTTFYLSKGTGTIKYNVAGGNQ